MASQPYYNAVAFISDIHSNIEALSAVLQDIKEHDTNGIYCLGDIVGYGPDPLACLDEILSLKKSGKLLELICGNHDCGVVQQNFKNFNSSAVLSNTWTLDVIKNTPGFSLLQEIALEDPVRTIGKFKLVHSTLNPDPKDWEYLRTKNASDNFVSRNIVFVGHSHVPALYSKYSSGKGWNPIALFENSGSYFYPPAKPESLEPGKGSTQYRLTLPDSFPTMIVNVGSVGQPRDQNAYARYVLYLNVDYTTYIEYRQVGYDIQTTVCKLKKRGLECDQKLAVQLLTGGHSTFDAQHPCPDWFPF